MIYTVETILDGENLGKHIWYAKPVVGEEGYIPFLRTMTKARIWALSRRGNGEFVIHARIIK
jgi:hypothetical protein